MKDSLAVEELANDPCGSRKLKYGNYQTKENLESSQNVLSDRYIPPEKTDDHKSSAPLIDTMSEMEEELEAELELLDININTSGLDGEIRYEIDHDLIVEFAHGELRADMLPVGNYSLNANDDSENISTSPDAFCNPNYAVSPRELSLRLHLVIQQRLEERVRELEQALQRSQKKLEAEQNLLRRVFTRSDIGSLPNKESPTALSEDHVSTKPFYLNLADDSLNAYDEGSIEFTGINNVEKLSSYEISSKFVNEMNYSIGSLTSGTEGNIDSKESELEALPSKGLFDFEEYQVISDSEFGEDIDRIDDDDECKMLIDQILEKTRQGSPAVLYAQRMLFSRDE